MRTKKEIEDKYNKEQEISSKFLKMYLDEQKLDSRNESYLRMHNKCEEKLFVLKWALGNCDWD